MIIDDITIVVPGGEVFKCKRMMLIFRRCWSKNWTCGGQVWPECYRFMDGGCKAARPRVM